MKPFWTALSMYSQIPVPETEWNADSMAWALCCFPFVGIAVGIALCLWLYFSLVFAIPVFLQGGMALAIPVLISGGIHLDGFCDTMDALASNAPREKRLEILKDTHAGAFSGIGCAVYMIVFFSAWCSIELSVKNIVVLSLTPVLSRSLSGLAAVTLPNARGSGLLACFTEFADLKKARIILLLWIILICISMIIISPAIGAACVAAGILTYIYYVKMSQKHFGGITGDLAGFFLQLCELCTVLAAALAGHFILL